MAATLLPFYGLHTSNYTLLASDDVVQFSCASGSLVATMPSASTVPVGKRYQVRRASDATPANTLTVNTTSSQTIDGRASGSIILSPADYMVVVSDGANWQVVTLQETVSAFYNGVCTGSVGSSFNFVTYPNLVRDSHSGYSGGVYTVKVAGTYNISASAVCLGGTLTVGNAFAIMIARNSNGIGTQTLRAATSTGNGTVTNCTSVNGYQLAVGDQIAIRVYNGATGTPYYGTLLDGSEFFFSISKVGN